MALWIYSQAYEVDTDNSTISTKSTSNTFVIGENTSSSTLTFLEPVTVLASPTPLASQSGTYYGYWEIDGSKWPVVAVGDKLYVFTNKDYAAGDPFDVTTSTLPLCLGPDTLITTPWGVCKISELKVGDLVVTLSGPKPVKFIGRSGSSIPDLRATGRMPIVIEAGALGRLGPDEALYCSPSHAFLIEGCLVEAQALINGNSIRQLETWHEFSFDYYSLELEEHGVIWANGLLTETYFPTVRGKGFSRENWVNYDDYVALYGEGGAMQELERPRIPFARQLPAEIRQLAGLPEADQADAAVSTYALT